MLQINPFGRPGSKLFVGVSEEWLLDEDVTSFPVSQSRLDMQVKLVTVKLQRVLKVITER